MKWARTQAMASPLFSGCWLNLGSPDAAEMAGLAGYDWALIDHEHGCGHLAGLVHEITALAPYTTAAIVRVSHIDAALFKQILDLGPAGLMIPNVETAEQARAAVQAIRIPPLGTRGVATSTRNVGYGWHYEQYLQEANDNLLTVVQIESGLSMKNLPQIAAEPGVDVLFVGPTDLSIDLQLSSDPTDPDFRAVLEQVASTAQVHGKKAGALVRNIEQARAYAALGYQFLALGSDRGMVAQGMKANRKALAGIHGSTP
jgi:2-keto-3-deoxy-L-rhamnonate aldolase RhmA